MSISFRLCLIIFLGFIPNGRASMEVQFEKDQSRPIVNLTVAFTKGAVTDPKNLEGLTNFMGEMTRRGTKVRKKEQIDLALDQMGAKLDIEIRPESINFRGAVLSSQLEPYLALFKEILTQPTFPENEIKKLKSEIISGIEEELGHDTSLGAHRFARFLFQGHPYGRSLLGTTHSIERLTQKDIQAHYDRLINAEHLFILGTGDSSEGRISDWAKEIAALRPSHPSVEDQKLLAEVDTPKNFPQRRLQIIDKPDRTQTQINVGQIGIHMKDPDFFPLYLGNHAFGAGSSFSSLLMVEVRVKRGWSYGASSIFKYGQKPRSWHYHLFPAAKDTADALALTLQMTEHLHEHGITEEQFNFAQRSLVNSAGFMYSTPKKRIENALLEKTLHLPKGFMQSFGPELEKVKLSQVNAAFKKFLKPDQLAISVLGTAKDLKGPLMKAARVTPEQVSVVPYTEE